MRSPFNRTEKYEKKSDGNVLFIQTQRYACTQKNNFKLSVNEQVVIEQRVKSLLNSPAVRALAVPGLFLSTTYYITYAKCIFSLQRKHTSETLINEVCLLHAKWLGRYLSDDVMTMIEEMMIPNFAGCGIVPPPCTYFRLNNSLLDSTDGFAP